MEAAGIAMEMNKSGMEDGNIDETEHGNEEQEWKMEHRNGNGNLGM